jgi:hypothetical protein
LDTLPLWSTSSAVKACQMALRSSSFKPPMAAAPAAPATPASTAGSDSPSAPLPPLGRRRSRRRHLTAEPRPGPTPCEATPPEPLGSAGLRRREYSAFCRVWDGKHHPDPSTWFPDQLRPFLGLTYTRNKCPLTTQRKNSRHWNEPQLATRREKGGHTRFRKVPRQSLKCPKLGRVEKGRGSKEGPLREGGWFISQ